MDSQQNKNTMLAIALSVLVLIGWQFFYVSPKLEAERRAAEIEAQRQEQIAGQQAPASSGTSGNAATQSGSSDLPSAQPSTGTAPGSGVTSDVPGSLAVDREKALASTPRAAFENDLVIGSINLVGGRIDDLRLKGYHETIDKSSPIVTLLSPSQAANGYFAEFGFISSPASGDVPGPKTEWKTAGNKLSPDSPLVLEWTNEKNVTFRRTITLDETYLFTIKEEIINNSGEPISLSSYGRITRFGEPATENIFVLHEGLIGYLGEEEGLEEIDYSDVKEDKEYSYAKADTGWLGITDKYWATAIIPKSGFTPRFSYFDDGRGRYQSDFLGSAISVTVGASATVKHNLFAGAKKEEIIDNYTKDKPGLLTGLFNALNSFFSSGNYINNDPDARFANFDLMIDWGWFYFITKPLFKLMNWLYHLLGNFGVAILVTTVLIKAVLFPLANLSYASMAKMKKVQPEMAKLKEAAGDDRVKLQQDMMALYKKEKINPAAGCWPMLVQIPIFFALYKVIYVTIEMRHAPFFGWIQDLSAADPTSILNLFGLMPWESPAILGILAIGIWPLFMGITMFLQMQMNPAPPDPTQQMIFKWMPIVFTFVLAPFPAGLVIYWAWNNFLSIIQQGVIMRKHDVKIELWDNLKGMFNRKKTDTPAK